MTMEEFIVIDTQTNSIVLNNTTWNNAYKYADFLNGYKQSKQYKCINKNSYMGVK